MNDQPRACLTARAMMAAMEGGTATSESLVVSCLAVIAAREPVVGAWMVVDADAAVSQARAVDQARRLGDKLPSLAGVPLAVKDNIDTARPCHELRLADLRGPSAAGRRRLRRAGQGRRSGGDRQDGHHRIRLLQPRQDHQPARSRAHARRLLAGVGGGGRGRHGGRWPSARRRPARSSAPPPIAAWSASSRPGARSRDRG